jgi:predicted RNA-binding protein (virulence factor B family)
MASIGKRNTLTVFRDSPSGIYLDGGEHGEIFALSEDGDTYVFHAGPEYKLLRKNAL